MKAARAATAVGRLMPNISDPSDVKRRLLATVVESHFMYAAPMRAKQATKYDMSRKAIEKIQHTVAIRVARALRTDSREATLLLANVISGNLLAKRRALHPEVIT